MPYGIAAYTGKLTLHGSKLQCQRSELGALTTFSKKLLAKNIGQMLSRLIVWAS
jgi:hypothetical protein